MLTEKQLERFKNLFEKEMLPSLIENKDELLKRGEEARTFIKKHEKRYEKDVDNK